MTLRPFSAPAKMFFSRGFRGLRFPRRREGHDEPEVVLDLSRLLSRGYYVTPTGIDRVEMAYARELLERIPDRLSFSAVHPAGGYYGRLHPGSVRQFLSHTYALWQNASVLSSPKIVQRAAIRHLLSLRPRAVPASSARRVLLQVSPHHLDQTSLMRSILKAENARFVTMVHDVIPITHAEYARPGELDRHLARMATIEELADGVIANSQSTLDTICPAFVTPRKGRVFDVIHLGYSNDDYASRAVHPHVSEDAPPYFMCVGTIEPRKNLIMLLNVWRRLVEMHGARAPRLIVVGRRGWEDENIVDMLERCRPLQGVVHEETAMSDAKLWELLRGARALLLPSFAEGFGMPVSEALVAGVPVICSDIPALREVGGSVPDYLDPIDGLSWRMMIDEFSTPHSPRRAAQIDRMSSWQTLSWRQHVDHALEMVAQVGRG